MSAYEAYMAKQAALLPDVKLRAHQEEADKRYNAGDGQILLAHDAGTGKTLSYLALHERRKAKGLAHKALVVTPAALEENFTEQGVHKFTDSTVTSVHRHGPVPNADYYTVSLEKFRTDPVGYMKRTGADSLIVDELHKARDPGSLNYKAIMAARAHAKNFIGGTGTPIMNHPHDIVPLLDMVTDKHHGLGTHERGSTFKPMNPKAFDVNFLEEKTQHHGALGFLGIGPTSTTTQLKNQSYLQRQLKNHIHHVGVDELGADMPIKKLHNVEVEMSTHQSKLYEFAMGQLDPLTRFKIKHNLPVGKAEAAHVFTRITQARQASNALHPLDRNHTAASSAEATPKARRVLDDVHAHLAADPKNKAIIYTNLVHGGVDQMVAGLRRRGHDPGLFIGSKHQKKSERSTHVADYLSGKRRVMIMNQAGTEGVNLPGTTAHFTLDPHFNPMQTMQAEARGIRAGSPVHQVDVYRYRSVAKKPLGFLPRETSTDEWVQGVADKKDDLNKQFMKLMG